MEIKMGNYFFKRKVLHVSMRSRKDVRVNQAVLHLGKGFTGLRAEMELNEISRTYAKLAKQWRD